MTPVQFKMVDLGGIDLVEIDGTAVPGIYNKILGAYNTCRVAILCNWFFAGILLPPAHVLITMDDDVLMINDVISVDIDDVLSIPGLSPSVVIEALTATENDTYTPGPGVNGFSPVVVDVPGPVLVQLTATENETYLPGTGEDGFSSVVVNVPAPAPVTVPLSVTENGTYTPEQGVDGFDEVVVNVPSDYPTLPSAYQEVEYLECYGAQYVQQNGIYLYNGDIISSAASLDTSVLSETEDGVMGGGKSSTYEVYFYDDILQFYGRITGSPINIEKGVKYPFIGTINNNPSGTCEDFALGRYSASYVHVGKIWRTTIQRNIFRSTDNHNTPNFPPTVFRDYVPCYRKADNKPGFFELFSSTFLTNLGSGEFGLGPEI